MPMLIILSVLIPIIVAAVIAFFVYIIGNVYNGFIRRRSKLETSWHELRKLIVKCYSALPSVIHTVETEPEIHQLLIDIYQTYQSLDIDSQISELAVIDADFKKFAKTFNLDSVPMSSKVGKDNIEFLLAERRNLDFSIPLYNSNVLDYEHFRRLPVNRLFAKVFKFGPKPYFMTEEKIQELREKRRLPR